MKVDRDSEALLMECAEYFKSNRGFDRLFVGMREKYRSLGHAGGTVVIRNLSETERHALSGLMKRDYSRKNSATINVESFKKALEGTRFEGIDVDRLLNVYFAEDIISKKMQRAGEKRLMEEFFQGIVQMYTGSEAFKWLTQALENRGNAYRFMVRKYREDAKKLLDSLKSVCDAINNLPCKKGILLRLPVFSSCITRNPHAFDRGTMAGNLLLHAISDLYGEKWPDTTEETAELLLKAGILYDEVSNHVLCYGLRAFANGELHPGWEGFYQKGEPIHVSLLNLNRLDKVSSPTGHVYVVENAGVFSTILDRTEGIEGSENRLSLICTYGQLKLAAVMLLDFLAEEGSIIYYSGDFDPEGLSIADRLKQRYKDRLKLWMYTVENYHKSLSGRRIDNSRLKKLEALQDEKLLGIAGEIRKTKLAGYQELILNEMYESISVQQHLMR